MSVNPLEGIPEMKMTDWRILRAEKTPIFPPSVAHAMLYLATKDQQKPVALYDPFVGSGTTLAVAMLNYDHVIKEHYGLDANAEAVIATQQNIGELKPEFNEQNIRHGNALTQAIPQSKYPVIVVTDPPFGRATSWVDQTGAPSEENKIGDFLQHMSQEGIERLVFCYDPKLNVERAIRDQFRLKDRVDLKDRRIYSLDKK
ncbi:N-6 DNA methylase [Candidatus Woesearchaeota archaeon]|nr:N-6 DNA methylase [Candidatus Woesearchaeota archaeon]